MVHSAEYPVSDFAVITVVPIVFPVTSPFSDTSATFSLLLEYVTFPECCVGEILNGILYVSLTLIIVLL